MAHQFRELEGEEDLEAILRLAVRQDTGQADLRERLRLAAAEMGISEQALARAEAEYLTQKAYTTDQREFNWRRWLDFRNHLLIYLAVIGCLVGLDFLTGGSSWWPFVALAWGIGLAVHGFSLLDRDSDDWHKEFDKWRRRRNRLPDDDED